MNRSIVTGTGDESRVLVEFLLCPARKLTIEILGGVGRTAVQREDFVRIVLAGLSDSQGLKFSAESGAFFQTYM
jgi:hypothetical protein